MPRVQFIWHLNRQNTSAVICKGFCVMRGPANWGQHGKGCSSNTIGTMSIHPDFHYGLLCLLWQLALILFRFNHWLYIRQCDCVYLCRRNTRAWCETKPIWPTSTSGWSILCFSCREKPIRLVSHLLRLWCISHNWFHIHSKTSSGLTVQIDQPQTASPC